MDHHSPLFEPPGLDVGPGDDTTVRYVGGGGGGGVLRLPWVASPGEAAVSLPPSLDWRTSEFLGRSSGDGTRGTEHAAAGGALAFGAGAGGKLEAESKGVGGEEVGGDSSSFGEAARCRASGVGGGDEGADSAAGSSEEVGEVGSGGAGSSSGGGDTGRGGAGSCGEGGDGGTVGAAASGRGGEPGKGGAGSSGDSALKQTHASLVSSPAGGAGSSGPKMLSRSAMEETSETDNQRGVRVWRSCSVNGKTDRDGEDSS